MAQKTSNEKGGMDLGLRGKVVLVTGGSRGIGRAAALAFAREGASVVIGARDREQIQAAADAITKDTGATVVALPVDTTKTNEVATFVDVSMREFGRCDVLVNAGSYGRGGRFQDLDEAAWHNAMDTKYFGYLRMARAVVPHMVAQRYGRIIHVIGVGGIEFLPSNIAGGAANAALYLLTKGMAHELAGNGVLVNAVSPGHIDTDRWRAVVTATAKGRNTGTEQAERGLLASVPLGRVGRPEEVADVIVFLASARASYITGACVAVDGGRTRSF